MKKPSATGWGMFLDLLGRTHIVPAYTDTAEIKEPHILREGCPCNPAFSDDGLIIHEQVN